MKSIMCPKCRHKNFHEDDFCEQCMQNLLDVLPQEEHTMWAKIVRS